MPATKAKPDALTTLKGLIKKFEQTAGRYAKLGATDSEPDGVFQVQLMKAVRGKDVNVPTTAAGWELYTGEPGVGLAAGDLARSCNKVVDFIKTVPIGESAGIKDYLRDYCWRVDSNWF